MCAPQPRRLIKYFRSNDCAEVTSDMMGDEYSCDPDALLDDMSQRMGLDVNVSSYITKTALTLPAIELSYDRGATMQGIIDASPVLILGMELHFYKEAAFYDYAATVEGGLQLYDYVVDGTKVIKKYGGNDDEPRDERPQAESVDLGVGLGVTVIAGNAIRVAKDFAKQVLMDRRLSCACSTASTSVLLSVARRCPKRDMAKDAWRRSKCSLCALRKNKPC